MTGQDEMECQHGSWENTVDHCCQDNHQHQRCVSCHVPRTVPMIVPVATPEAWCEGF